MTLLDRLRDRLPWKKNKPSNNPEMVEMVRNLIAEYKSKRLLCQDCGGLGKQLNPSTGRMFIDCLPCDGNGWTLK